MSELDNLLYNRRSIRKYTRRIPPEKLIREMIHGALCAPSPSNSQPVRFVRIASPEKRHALRGAMVSGRDTLLESAKKKEKPKRLRNRINVYWRYSEFMFHAPVLFAVGTKTDVAGFSDHLRRAGLVEASQGRTDMDLSVGLALKGFILKGHEQGLGGCILTAPLVFAPRSTEILELTGIRLTCFATVGYPDEAPPRPERLAVEDVYREI